MGHPSVLHLLANPAVTEMLNRTMESGITKADAHKLVAECPADTLVAVAGRIRDSTRPGAVTYSRKVFINLINLCRDTCTYCTYKKEPREPILYMLAPPQAPALNDPGNK